MDEPRVFSPKGAKCDSLGRSPRDSARVLASKPQGGAIIDHRHADYSAPLGLSPLLICRGPGAAPQAITFRPFGATERLVGVTAAVFVFALAAVPCRADESTAQTVADVNRKMV